MKGFDEKFNRSHLNSKLKFGNEGTRNLLLQNMKLRNSVFHTKKWKSWCACVRVCMCWEYSCESERMESWGYLRIFLFNWEKLKSSEKENFQFHESCILLWVSRSPVKAHHHRRSHTLPLFFLLSKMVFHLNIHE